MKKVIVAVIAVSLFTIGILQNPANADMNPAKSKVQTVDVHGRYSIDLPTYLTEGHDLNFEASLEYQNINKEVYIIVIDESTEEFIKVFTELDDYDTTKSALDNYADAQMESIRANMSSVTSESQPRKVKTQSGEAIVSDVAGLQDGIDDAMGFTVAFTQGKLCLYMIMTWTFEKTKSIYQEDMNGIIASFKELSGALDTFPHTIETDRYSVSIPKGFFPDTNACTVNCAGYSRAEGNIYLAITEFEQAEWKNAYKTWPDRKEHTLLEYFTLDQKNFRSKNAPLGTTYSELKKGSTNGAATCTFSRTEPANGENASWFYESVIVQGKDHFYYIDLFCPTEQLAVNQNDMKLIRDSFKVR